MSKKFEKVKGYYDSGLWKESRVRDAVEKGWITVAEFTEITGIEY
jgi:hypothetical protein